MAKTPAITCASVLVPLTSNNCMKRAATWVLVLPFMLLADDAPYSAGKFDAIQLPSAVEFGEPLQAMIRACPFLLCQKPMVAVSPVLTFEPVGGIGTVTEQ